MSFPYDKSSKWLLDHHGDQILRLAGITGIVAWKACQAEVVLAGQLSDGVLEVQLAGQAEPSLFILEIATYPERRAETQLIRDLLVVFAQRQVLPEVIVVVLHPRGNLRIEPSSEWTSPNGCTRLAMHWRVVELWTLEAAPLLAADEPGLVPWIPLTRFDGPPEIMFQRCRGILDRKAAAEERDALLAVSQVLAALRFNDPRMLAYLGGKQIMIESPVIQELLAEQNHKVIVKILRSRFGVVPSELTTAVEGIGDVERLCELAVVAAKCQNLAEFQAAFAV